MLDKWMVPWTQPLLHRIARRLCRTGVTADQVSWAGFLVGLAAIPALWQQQYRLALGLMLANRILDGLDGALARRRGPTDAGGFLDITLDFIFYAGVVWGFALAAPERNSLAAATLLFTFIGTASSFLAFAVMAAKRGLQNLRLPKKSLYYLHGLTEGTETILFLSLFCLWPDYFPTLAYTFAALCGVTTLVRLIAGYRMLRRVPPNEASPREGQGSDQA